MWSAGGQTSISMQANPALEIVECDVADKPAVMRACAGVDRIFHLAARADVVPSIQEPEAYFRANVDGTFAVLEGARTHGVRAHRLRRIFVMLWYPERLSDTGDHGR